MARRRDQQRLPGLDYETLNIGMDLILAGGGKDGVLQSGPWFAVHFQTPGTPNVSTVLEGIQAGGLIKANLAGAVTANIELNWQDATDSSGTGAANAGSIFPDPAASPGFLLGTGALVDVLSVVKFQQDLESFRAFARLQWLVTISSGATDTIDLAFCGRASGGTGPVATT